MIEKIKKLFLMDGSPHAIALGFGVGVFLGLLPGTGPIAAVALAFAFRLNKLATLLGSVLTNTWLSVVTFAASLKLGAWICGLHWQDMYAQAQDLMHHFSWKSLWDVSLLQILKPLLIGYAVVGILCGLGAYLLVRLILLLRRRAAH